jgi:hypothetical protein
MILVIDARPSICIGTDRARAFRMTHQPSGNSAIVVSTKIANDGDGTDCPVETQGALARIDTKTFCASTCMPRPAADGPNEIEDVWNKGGGNRLPRLCSHRAPSLDTGRCRNETGRPGNRSLEGILTAS